ncbi:hypothetical protein [Cryobacterium psychrophilum]|uniref:Uncharacterized protein n=1 Tax=Cryobacterium psychrophilum TaxID=41988 RepID=A0A4Y8KMQ4_9MICO|nr:hypothetical protein [Cryobacterium psychrophilum]TDW30324.1 hypothetical protein EDD25_2073 [Cryobacterium psychrophilum]TFD77537.1 hypothetical protein E3T53_12065 [Cryobacterium psychrophilum]
MNWWILLGMAGIVLLGLVASRLGWVDLSNKNERRGSGSSVLGIGDEVFAPSRYEAAVEMERQTVLPAPAPAAGDGDLGIYDGRIRIDVDRPMADDGVRRGQRHCGASRS